MDGAERLRLGEGVKQDSPDPGDSTIHQAVLNSFRNLSPVNPNQNCYLPHSSELFIFAGTKSQDHKDSPTAYESSHPDREDRQPSNLLQVFEIGDDSDAEQEPAKLEDFDGDEAHQPAEKCGHTNKRELAEICGPHKKHPNMLRLSHQGMSSASPFT